MKKITIKIIYDNSSANKAFQEGWGFSCLVDLGLHKILFDTGANLQIFSSNFQKFDLHYEEITDVVFSHKHLDHIAGSKEISRNLTKDCHIFLPKKFPIKEISSNVQAEYIEGFKEIDSDIYTLVLKSGFFLYEQALLLKTEKGLVVITGCAHPGIIHLLEEIQKLLKQPIYMVLGGLHLFRAKQRQIIEIINQLKALKLQKIAPCHCTGKLAIDHFQNAFLDNFYKIGAGTIFQIDN